MLEIRPFEGVFYRDADLAKVLAPPYDVIPPDYQNALYDRDPHNVVRLVLNRTPGDAAYREAGETYRRWLAEGVLAADPRPALYLLEQSFVLNERRLRRYGLLARFRAVDPQAGVVLPHEHTRRAAKEDRYRVLRATRANFSPIFLMFPEAGRFAARVAVVIGGPAAVVFSDDAGVRHRLWRVTEPEAIASFQEILGAGKAYIADGHHRYATALRYRDEVGADGAWTLGYFTPLGAPGLAVLPYHRILAEGPSLAEARRALEGTFAVKASKDAASAAREVAESKAPHAFALAARAGGALTVELNAGRPPLLEDAEPASLRALDTYFLHHAVLQRFLNVPEEAVGYVHSLAEAEEALANDRCRLAVLMRPTPVEQIVAVADARQSMPAKSTFFHPKLPSGLVIHPLLA